MVRIFYSILHQGLFQQHHVSQRKLILITFSFTPDQISYIAQAVNLHNPKNYFSWLANAPPIIVIYPKASLTFLNNLCIKPFFSPLTGGVKTGTINKELRYMNNKHQKTLNEIFANPIKANIRWNDVRRLFISLGAEIKEGSGSRVGIALRSVNLVLHRPHPQKELGKAALISVRKFLRKAGVPL